METITALKALANEKRFQIVQWLREPSKHFTSTHCDVNTDGVCVGLIEKKIGLSQSTVSQYLSQLEKAKIITMKRNGQWTYYQLNKKFVKEFVSKLDTLI